MRSHIVLAFFVLTALPTIAFADSSTSLEPGASMSPLLRESLHPLSSRVLSAAFQNPQSQAAYDKAVADKNAGKKKMIVGGAVLAGGAVLMTAGSGFTSLTGYFAVLGGAGYGGYGVYKFLKASSTIEELDRQRGQSKTTELLPLGAHQGIGLQASLAPTVSYQLHW